MFQKTFTIDDPDQAVKFLSDVALQKESEQASAILAQVYVANYDVIVMRSIYDALHAFSALITIVGATTAGEICNGKLQLGSSIVILSFFQATQLRTTSLNIEPGDESAAGQSLVKTLKSFDRDPVGVLMLSTPLSINCNVLLSTIHEHVPGLPLFGGGAGDYAQLNETFVFHGEQVLKAGVVLVSFLSESLHIFRSAFLGWKPIGKIMTVTRVDGLTVKEIDGRPAFEIYERYLGIKADENFFLNALEFPFLVRREGIYLARVPVFTDKEGGVTFIADIKQGDKLQLGYGDINVVLEEARTLQHQVSCFKPEALFVYSCGCRRFLMQQDVDLELQPLQNIAPSSGFFTYGEICDLTDQSPFLNATLVVAALREGEAERNEGEEHLQQETENTDDLCQYRHARVLQRFQYFLDAVTSELIDANRAKSNFLASMNHEIRTPMHVIIGYTEIAMKKLANKEGCEKPIKDLEEVLAASNRLIKLINDVLDFSRLDAGQVILNIESTNLDTVLHEISFLVAPLMNANRNSLQIKQTLSHSVVKIDELRLGQILLNLLSNAAKFTQDGEIVLEVAREKEKLVINVSDTGIGMSNEQQKIIFDDFRQADMNITRQYGGTGLGLGIVRRLVSLMDGDIKVKSHLYVGTTFTLHIPLAE